MRRDPVATRQKLLVAARREFAQSGLAGARVDEIAARAGVNKQLVYHYFGDKDALYLAVLEWVYEEIRAQERKLNLEGLPPEQAIKKLIESSFDHLAPARPPSAPAANTWSTWSCRHCGRSASPSLRGATRRSNPLSAWAVAWIASRSLSSGAQSRDPAGSQ